MTTCLERMGRGLEISNDWFDPLGCAVQKTDLMRNFYQNHPIGARFVTITANTFLGLVKVFLLPGMSAIGAIAMPIIAAAKAYNGDVEGAKDWLAAWAFCLVAGAGVIGFFALSGFHMTLLQGTALFVVGASASIIIHVSRVAYEPEDPEAAAR